MKIWDNFNVMRQEVSVVDLPPKVHITPVFFKIGFLEDFRGFIHSTKNTEITSFNFGAPIAWRPKNKFVREREQTIGPTLEVRLSAGTCLGKQIILKIVQEP